MIFFNLVDKSDNSNGIRPPLLGERPPSPHRFPEYNETRIKTEPQGILCI